MGTKLKIAVRHGYDFCEKNLKYHVRLSLSVSLFGFKTYIYSN